MSNLYYTKLDFKEEDFVYLVVDGKINKDKIYKVNKFEYIEGGSYFDGFEVYINAYLEDIETNNVIKLNVAFFSIMQRITHIYAFNTENFK